LSGESLEEIRTVIEAALPVVIWRGLYALGSALGFDNGPWLGVLFNSFLVGLSGSLTVRTGRLFFGKDAWRLQLIGTLFASCGLFWLFGAIFVRDSFSLVLNALVLYAFVRTLVAPCSKNLLFLCGILAGVSPCIYYVRLEETPMRHTCRPGPLFLFYRLRIYQRGKGNG
jgi:hypothetical protein